MKDAELYSGGVDPKRQAEHEVWLEQKYSPEAGAHIQAGRRKKQSLSEADRAATVSALKDIERSLARALKDGVPPDAPALNRVCSGSRLPTVCRSGAVGCRGTYGV